MKNTSKKAYKEIKESGYMTRKQKEVYNCICDFGPITGAEINKITFSTSNHKRVSELADLGMIVEYGTKLDSNTNKLVVMWTKAPVGYKPQQRDICLSEARMNKTTGVPKDILSLSEMYDAVYIQGWTDCINNLGIPIPLNKVLPTKVWE